MEIKRKRLLVVMVSRDDVTQNIKTIKTIPLQLKGNYPEKFDIQEKYLPFAGFEKRFRFN
jgi:NAD-dependent DNA ligase